MFLFSGSSRPLVRGHAFSEVILIPNTSKLGVELKMSDSNRKALADQFPGLLVAQKAVFRPGQFRRAQLLLCQFVRVAFRHLLPVGPFDNLAAVTAGNAEDLAGLLEAGGPWLAFRFGDPDLAGVTFENVIADSDRQSHLVNGVFAAIAAGLLGASLQLRRVAKADGNA